MKTMYKVEQEFYAGMDIWKTKYRMREDIGWLKTFEEAKAIAEQITPNHEKLSLKGWRIVARTMDEQTFFLHENVVAHN